MTDPEEWRKTYNEAESRSSKKKYIIIAIVVVIVLIIPILYFIASMQQQQLIRETAGAAQKQAEETAERMCKIIKIESATDNAITVKNVGTCDINATELKIYIDAAPQTCNWDKDSVTPNEVITADCSCETGQRVKAVGPVNDDSFECQ